MENNNSIELAILSSSKQLFVHKDVDLSKSNVIAAIAAAAGGMSLVADPDIEASKETVINAIIQSYKKGDGSTAFEMVDMMNPSTVKSVIGFSPDYMDFGNAYATYIAQKEEYDKLFSLTNKLQLTDVEQHKTL